jgi:hypothetical protein
MTKIDAYMHAGGPRFGSGHQAAGEMDRFDIAKANIVLPPAMPDFAALEEIRDSKGENVRLFGVPAGEDEARRLELTQWQIKFGITGMRLMPFEWEPNRSGIEALGEAGRFLFFINPYQGEMIRELLAWLEKYPKGQIAAPHFVRPGAPREVIDDYDAFADLLRHPRFSAILSRHGECGSTTKWPFPDLKPWVEGVLELTGWERVMWGSEYPVIYWRDEEIPETTTWLESLLPRIDPQQKEAFLAGNAQRVFYDVPPPPADARAAEAPAWSREWVAGGGSGSPILRRGLKLSAEAQQTLMQRYLQSTPEGERGAFSAFVAAEIDRLIARDSS